MLTPEEIRNITFTKGIGGYKTNEVDLFIDQCADTVETPSVGKGRADEEAGDSGRQAGGIPQRRRQHPHRFAQRPALGRYRGARGQS